jgi:O-antigen/teichoic acid export membrane protein
VIKNTFFNSLGTIWGGLLTFIITPYIVYRLGTDRFGLLSIIAVLTGYLGLIDCSFGSAYIRNIAHFHSQQDHLAINQIAVAGTIFYTILSAILFMLVILLMPSLLDLLNVPDYLHEEASFILYLAVGLLAFTSIMSIFPSVVNGLQRMDISNAVSILLSIPSTVGVVIVLKSGFGLKGLMINNTVFQVLNSLVMMYFAYRLFPKLNLNIFHFRLKVFSSLFNFGIKVHLARISGAITSQIDKIYITYFLAIGLVTYFQLANSIVIYTSAIAGLMVSALLPAFSELEGRGDRQTLVNAYLRGTKYLAFLTIPFFCFIGMSASTLMTVWMGRGYEQSIAIIQILSVGWMINTLAQVGASVCVAMDRAQIMVTGSIINVFLNLTLNILFIKLFGFNGVAWGTSVAVIFGTVYFLFMLHKELSIPIKSLFRALMPFLISSLIAAFFVFIVSRSVMNIPFALNRFGAFILLCVKGSLFTAIYLIAIRIAGVFSADDIHFFRDKIPFLRSILFSRSPI